MADVRRGSDCFSYKVFCDLHRLNNINATRQIRSYRGGKRTTRAVCRGRLDKLRLKNFPSITDE